MRKMITAILVMSFVNAGAQTTDDDGKPVIYTCPLDTSLNGGKAFSSELARSLGGFSLAFMDTTTSKTVLSVYQSNGPEGLRVTIKYRYAASDADTQQAVQKGIVNYVKISATEATMARAFNFIFHENLQANQLSAVRSNGSPAKYHDNNCMYILEEADYRPGFWELTLVK